MKRTDEKGITLVTLVITVTIMLLLVGVVVKNVTKDDPIRGAKNLVNKVENQEETLNDVRNEVRNMMR